MFGSELKVLDAAPRAWTRVWIRWRSKNTSLSVMWPSSRTIFNGALASWTPGFALTVRHGATRTGAQAVLGCAFYAR